jgi:putative membrane protein
VKHFLRGEQGVYYEDLYPLISFLPKYANDSDGPGAELLPLWHEEPELSHKPDMPPTELARDSQSTNDRDAEKGIAVAHPGADRPLKPARMPPTPSFLDYIPLLRLFRWIGRKVTGSPRKAHGRKKAYHDYVESQVPLEIILVLSK